MLFLSRVMEFLTQTNEIPKLFGPTHITSFILSISLGIALSLLFRKADKKTVRYILLVASVISILLEIYKQFVYSHTFDGHVMSFDYQWFVFPFQVCSTPMYVGLLAAITKKDTIHKPLCAFLATYGLFAGFAVMVYPGDVFINVVGINIQTMVCHGLMVSIGIFLLATGYVRPRHSSMLGALCVFTVIIVIATVLNETVYNSGILHGETFDMFFISRHFESKLPIYSDIEKVIPYPYCLGVYIFCFSSAAYVLLLINMGVRRLVSLFTKKKVSIQ